jgi:hypothetical protein
MGQLPNLVKLGVRLALQIMPSVAATVIGGYLLAQIHFARAPEPQQAAAPAASTQEEVPTVREERAAMRDVLKARRENPETPAQVRPKVVAVVPASVPASMSASIPVSAPASAPIRAPLPAAMDSIGPNEPVERAGVPSRTSIAVAPALPRARPDAAASVAAPSVYVPAPPPGLPPAPAASPTLAEPTPLAPVVVGTAAEPPLQAAPPPPPTGPVGAVFSTLSKVVGHAANATGDTVNWVIDLPGKAIAVGGRVIGVNSPPPPPSRPFS